MIQFSQHFHFFRSFIFSNLLFAPQEVTIQIQNNYENMPRQYLAIFHGCKIDNFQMKNCDIFLVFAQNIDCGYSLEPPQ